MQHLSMEAQNNLIDSASDDALFNAIKEANGYGQRYASLEEKVLMQKHLRIFEKH